MMRFYTYILKSQRLKLFAVIFCITAQYSCGNSSANNPAQAGPQQPPQLPVIQIDTAAAITYQAYPATIQGRVNVEIRPQVDGYLQKLYVDEGAYVKAGQPLYKISDALYAEALNNARASLQSAEAGAQRAKVDADRLQPLVQNNVISDVQLKTAQANYAAAQASVVQMKAMVSTAEINVGYTLIKAPVSGYIGRQIFKTGALVYKSQVDALTVLSDVSEVYAYFSLSENDFTAFKDQFQGNTMKEKLAKVPPVELMLANDSLYNIKGKIEIVEGQFDAGTGSISFRATFPNAAGVLRSGNTGKVRIPQLHTTLVIVPQEATYEVQDKVFVYVVGDSNKVAGTPIDIIDKTANYYFVDKGIKSGDKIVLQGTGNLKEGMKINPQLVSKDSLMKAKPLNSL